MELPVVWIALFAVVAGFDVLIATLSLTKHSPEGLSLGLACIGAAVVTSSYLVSVFIEDYFWYSVFSSVYFIGIDAALTTLVIFVRKFVSGTDAPGLGWGIRALIVWGAIDAAILAANPFYEVAISYTYMADAFNHYGYVMHLPYYLHLTFAYVNIVAVVAFLANKALRVPSVYRRQYQYAIASLALVVGINAFYLYFSTNGDSRHILDFSLLGYSVAAALFYWICFVYREHGMLDTLRGYIFANMGQGIILFDYEGNLLMQNDRARRMLQGFFAERTPTVEDMAQLLPTKVLGLVGDGRTHTFQCYPTHGENLRPLICEYCTLLGGRRGAETLGFLFMLSELSSEFDRLTGFFALEAFRNNDDDTVCERGGCALACDINDLAGLNAKLGHDEGDKAIQELARLMRKHLPTNTVFVRENDAVLAAVCEGADEETLRSCSRAIRADIESAGGVSFDFQSGVSSFSAGTRCSQAVLSARDTLRMRKLLDPSSRRSETLYSLVRMLQSCDPDTEAHVRRTQKLCDRLGDRIGLSEEDQNNLALLALLHDIGKTSVPLDILNKPGKLTEAERRVIMNHVVKGYQIAMETPDLHGIADAILYHHERWDGKGYPDGLSKESIPLLSRIISVVDSYDAMTNDRPYRKAMPKEAACRELKRRAGTQFDPALVTNFLQMLFDANIIDSLPQDDEDAPAADAAEATLPDKPVWQSRQLLQEGTEDSLGTPRLHTLDFARYELSADWKVLEIDEAFAKLTGYTEEDVARLGLTQQNLVFKKDFREYERIVNEGLAQRPEIYLEHWLRRKDGKGVFVFCMGRHYYNSAEREDRIEVLLCDSAASYSVQTVIQKEYARATRRLERWESKYRRDPLTGLLNHEAFKNDIEARLLAGSTHALMLMIDIDDFKGYNDSCGHHAGDELLAMVAQTLMSTLRKSDFACRMGGDEFAALLFFDEATPQDTMQRRAAQILDKLNLTLAALDTEQASVSMGGAFLIPERDTFEQLYEAADRALYRSKADGKARLSF